MVHSSCSRYLPRHALAERGLCFTDAERQRLDNEVMQFLSSAASEVQELNRVLETVISSGGVAESSATIVHNKHMVSDLLSVSYLQYSITNRPLCILIDSTCLTLLDYSNSYCCMPILITEAGRVVVSVRQDAAGVTQAPVEPLPPLR